MAESSSAASASSAAAAPALPAAASAAPATTGASSPSDLATAAEREAYDKICSDSTRLEALTKRKGILPDMLPPNKLEAKIIAELRKEAEKIKGYETELSEEMLIRYCRGFTLNQWKKLPVPEAVANTKVVLRHAIQWRVKNKISQILLTENMPPRNNLFRKYWINAVVGVDSIGRQINMMHPPRKEMLTEFGPEHGEEFVLNLVRHLEDLSNRRLKEGIKRDALLYKQVVIIDMGIESVSLAMIKLLKQLTTVTMDGVQHSVMEDFYPETSYRTWLINVPFALRAIMKLGLAFVNPITRAKIRVCKDMALDEMAKDGIPRSALPKYMGGTNPDPPGFHYQKNVANGSKLQLKFEAPPKRGFKWDVEVKKRDIFLTIAVTIGGKTEILVNKQKLDDAKPCNTASHPGGGDSAATLTVTFDNSHSSWYTKDVAYEVCVV